jgi:hypothetical protein
MVPPDQVCTEAAQPIRWVIQSRSNVRCAHQDPVRRALPAGPAPPSAGESGHLPAGDTHRVRIRRPTRV